MMHDVTDLCIQEGAKIGNPLLASQIISKKRI